jgi:hypothetical protein
MTPSAKNDTNSSHDISLLSEINNEIKTLKTVNLQVLHYVSLSIEHECYMSRTACTVLIDQFSSTVNLSYKKTVGLTLEATFLFGLEIHVIICGYFSENENLKFNVLKITSLFLIQYITIVDYNRELWCLMPLSTIFQLYRGCQFYWLRKLESGENYRSVASH